MPRDTQPLPSPSPFDGYDQEQILNTCKAIRGAIHYSGVAMEARAIQSGNVRVGIAGLAAIEAADRINCEHPNGPTWEWKCNLI